MFVVAAAALGRGAASVGGRTPARARRRSSATSALSHRSSRPPTSRRSCSPSAPAASTPTRDGRRSSPSACSTSSSGRRRQEARRAGAAPRPAPRPLRLGLTGRGPSGRALRRGAYVLRLVRIRRRRRRRHEALDRAGRLRDQARGLSRDGVTTLDAPVTSHLKEDPWEMARDQLRRVAGLIDVGRRACSTSSPSARRRSPSPFRPGWTTAPWTSSRASGSRTTSRAAPPRAGSATTRTSPWTRRRRSPCG